MAKMNIKSLKKLCCSMILKTFVLQKYFAYYDIKFSSCFFERAGS